MFLRLLSELAVCGDRFPVFPVNAPSLLCDLIWHNPGRLGPRTQRRWTLLLLLMLLLHVEGSFCSTGGSLICLGEEKMKHCSRNAALFSLPLLQSIICKQSRGGIEEVRQPDQYTHLHTKHAEYVWERSSMRRLFPPRYFPRWMTRLMPCPGTAPVSLS